MATDAEGEDGEVVEIPNPGAAIVVTRKSPSSTKGGRPPSSLTVSCAGPGLLSCAHAGRAGCFRGLRGGAGRRQTAEPAAHEYVKPMIHFLTVASDPRKWWNTIRHCKTKLWRIQARLHSIEPASIATERANKYLKAVMQPARSSMASSRVVMATFVYANLRFLNNLSRRSISRMASWSFSPRTRQEP